MDEDQILQSIIADPDVVDPTIDVSQLRQATETDPRLLGGVSGIEGLRFDPTRTDYIRDLYSVYSGGLPTIDVAQDTAQIPEAIDTLVDAGGGGGGIGQDQVTGDSVAGFDPGVTPGPSGFIGLDPDMDIDPQDFAQEDYGIYDPPELGGVDGMSGGQATPGAEFADQNPYGGTGSMDDLGADSFPEYQEPTVSQQDVIGTDANVGFVDAPATEPTVQDVIGTDANVGFVDAPATEPTVQDVIGTDANVGFVDAPATELGSQINSAFENVKDQGVGAIESFKDTLVELGGKVKEGFDNVIEFGDTQIDVGRTLATGAINYIGKSIFGPVGAVLGTALGALGIEGGRSDLSDRLGEKYGMDDIGRLTGGPMAGYSVDSAFGDIRQATVDRINKRKENNLDTQELEQFLSEIDYLGGDPVGANTELDIATGNITGDASVAEDAEAGGRQGALDARDDLAGVTTGDASVAEAEAAKDRNEAFADIQNQIGQTRDQDTGPTSTDPADDFDDGTMTGGAAPSTNKTGIDSFFDAVDEAAGGNTPSVGLTDAQAAANQDAARGGNTGSTGMSDAQAAANQDAARGGGSGSSSGGKGIVCTMMNDFYGFGSFRNKIWLEHSKSLAPEYQKGYHKIFLPLVAYARKDGAANKIVRKTLEHIAVHRTIDIRQESRGKVHLLGRVYRKILEPICYLVGKYVK
jgi:hypothetical protein